MTKKILHVLDHSIPLHSGYTFRSRSIINHQRAMGYETFHVTGSKQGNYQVAEEVVDGLKFFRTPPGSWSNIPILNQWDVIRGLQKRIEQLIRQEQPDIIHAHSPALNGMAAIRAAASFNIPVVYEVRAFWEDAAVDHGTTSENSIRYRVTRHLETHVMEQASAITCICEGLRQDIVARGFSKEKITVIPNAVNVEQFEFDAPADSELKQKYQLDECTTLGFIGSFYGYEGIDQLVEALTKINSKVKLLLVGGGQEEPKIRNMVEQHQLTDKVIFTGRVPHHEVSKYYDAVDIFVYARKSMRLTDLVTPLKPLEAMAKGRLVVASDVGGHQELINHGHTGFLFSANNVNALAETIDSVISRKNEWGDIKKNGRHFVENERTWVNSVGRYREVYDRVTAR